MSKEVSDRQRKSSSLPVQLQRTGDPPLWPSTLPDPIGVDRLRTFKPTDLQLQHFSSRVLLSDLSYYNLAFYEQSEGNPEQFVCERMCDLKSIRMQVHGTSTTFEDCEMDLIENWREVVGAVHEQGREDLLPQLDVQVGVVQCSGGSYTSHVWPSRHHPCTV